MINCKLYTNLKKQELKMRIAEYNLRPKLVVIQIGDDPASNSYIKGKQNDCKEVGIEFELIKYREDVTMDELRNTIINLNISDDVDGIILQLPVPLHINVKEIQELISRDKDVDGFNLMSKFIPCTPLGIVSYLKHNGYLFEGKNAVVIGRSDIVGKPLAKLLIDLNATVTLCHSKTKNINNILSNADIIFTCIDKVGYYKPCDYGFYGSDIIDIGLGRNDEGKLIGNLNPKLVENLNNFCNKKIVISGIGGVGLLTRLALMNNVVKAYEIKHKEEKYEV